MLDRVREAMFSSLGDEVIDARVLDLFAGSGSLGLEALSRGAQHARFVERSGRAARLVRENAEALRESERALVVEGDALSPASWRDPSDSEPYSLVFYDPPYALLRERSSRDRVLAAIGEMFELALSPDATLVFHAPRGEVDADELAGFHARERHYGTSTLWYLRGGGA